MIEVARPGRLSLQDPPPLSVYVHIPWCLAKCPYCDFNSHAVRGELPERRYVDALRADLEQSLPDVWGRRVHSVFFGGGTPSLLSPEALDRILTDLRTLLQIAADAEITLEANPGTVEQRRFAAYRDAGVNRLSIGIQSFDPTRLRALGRVHDEREALAAAECARGLFDNFNLDLMYALPGQGIQDALADIETALAFAPPHLSAYHLTIEPNTLFHRDPPSGIPDPDLAADMQDAIEQRLSDAGFAHYETSAHAQPGRAARHNLNYWTFGDYLGIGAGAHSKLSRRDAIVRAMRFKHPQTFMERALAGNAVQESHEVPVGDVGFEFMMNALRLCDGFDAGLFLQRTGRPLTTVETRLASAESKGLVERDHLRIRPTERGRRYLNELLQIFLPS